MPISATREWNDQTLAALRVLLDQIIPASADGHMPAASDTGCAETVIELVREDESVGSLIHRGAAALEEKASASDTEIGAMHPGTATALVEEVEAQHPGLLGTLTFSAFLAYYQQAEVVAALGLRAGAPHPQGHTMEPMNEDLLKPVRERGRLYR